MTNTKEYKCTKCGAIIEFNSSSQSMKCPFCDSEFNIDEFNDSDISQKWSDQESFGIYHCESCGAELITDETTAATHCPYCDNPIILMDRLSGQIKPDYIIPFQYDKKSAKSALYNHFKDKKFLPKVFKDENHLDEIKGIYVPFWLFDTDANIESGYEMKNTRMWSDMNYNYMETSIYHAERSGTLSFEKVPVDGSEKMSNDLMESIEAFDYSQIVPFKSAYLSGFFADKYDVNSDECSFRIRERIIRTANESVDSTVKGYDSVTKTSTHASFSNTRIHYALLPVWILTTSWRDKKYIFAMNGQTGKFVGELPLDKIRYAKYRILYTLAFGGGLWLLTYLFKMIM